MHIIRYIDLHKSTTISGTLFYVLDLIYLIFLRKNLFFLIYINLLQYKESDINRDLMDKIIGEVLVENNENFQFYINLNGIQDTKVSFNISGKEINMFLT